MASRDRGMSGSNTTPLGARGGGGPQLGGGPSIGGGGGNLLKPSYLGMQSSMQSMVPPPGIIPNPAPSFIKKELENDRKRTADTREGRPASKEADRAERRKKRKSRWCGTEDDKTFIPGMPTMIPMGLSKEQEEAYMLQLKIEDTSRRLRSGDLGIAVNPEDRSPSPEPIYSSDGKRLNTRDYRKRKELEENRHAAIQRMMEINLEYKPPADYKAPQIKVSDKVMIPQDQHPDINFVGLLIGPRGNTLKSMEKETGARIIIRGKGSVKEGKVGRKDGQPLPGEDEPLHAYVTAIDPAAVKRAVKKIMEVIQQGVEVPEGQNDLRRNQLRELALLNGTLREGDAPRCTNCGATDHKAWQCQDKDNVTNAIVCTVCGGVGHIANDCRQKRPGAGGPGQFSNNANNKIDEEYMSLMAELGEGPPPPTSSGGGQSRPAGGGQQMFRGPQGAPRALMGPGGGPPPPPGGAPQGPPGWGNHEQGGWDRWSGRGGGEAKPPSLMSQHVAPPWGNQAGGGKGGPPGGGSGGGFGSWNGPPPAGGGGQRGPPPPPAPPGGQFPPWGGPPSTSAGGSYSQGAPPGFLSAPPPPPPPGGSGKPSPGSSMPPPSSGPPQGWPAPPGPPAWGAPPGPPAAPGPRPVPAPPSGRGGPPPMPPYWPQGGAGGQGWQNQPPPGGQNVMSNLLGAPPPPPPPS